MSKYIRKNTLSVGYNNTGQLFFNILNKYKDYIHSFFFSLNCDVKGVRYNIEETINTLKNIDTYDIPGNLLLNEIMSHNTPNFFIDMAYTVCNLKAVTVLSLENAMIIKEKHPELEVHLSVRFWDWNHDPNLDPKEVLIKELSLIRKCVDVINISGAMSYNDHELIKLIHDNGIKTKIITNEGCIVNRSANYKHFPGYEINSCILKNGCNRICDKLISSQPWMILCTINYFKESLQFYDFDILKLSTREISNNILVESMINYFVSDNPTNNIFVNRNKSIDITSCYDLFLEWIERRSKCSNNCFNCRKCEEIYSKMGENI